MPGVSRTKKVQVEERQEVKVWFSFQQRYMSLRIADLLLWAQRRSLLPGSYFLPGWCEQLHSLVKRSSWCRQKTAAWKIRLWSKIFWSQKLLSSAFLYFTRVYHVWNQKDGVLLWVSFGFRDAKDQSPRTRFPVRHGMRFPSRNYRCKDGHISA